MSKTQELRAALELASSRIGCTECDGGGLCPKCREVYAWAQSVLSGIPATGAGQTAPPSQCTNCRADILVGGLCPRCAEALQRQNEAMREALQNLLDEQNGPPLVRREAQWQKAVDEARAALSPTAGSDLVPRPKIICICGSTRFVGEMAIEAWKLEKQGVMVLGPHLLPSWYEGVQDGHQAEAEGVAHILDELHLRKIDLSDEVLVVNCAIPGHENGYIGERTRAEIAYAKEHNKPISYLI